MSRLDVKLEIVNKADIRRDELMTDLVAIITSFAARLYGQRRAKRKTANFHCYTASVRTRLNNVKNIVKHTLIFLKPHILGRERIKMQLVERRVIKDNHLAI